MNETFEELIQELKQRKDLSDKDIESLMNTTASNILELIQTLGDNDILSILYYPTKNWNVGEPTFRSFKMSASMFPEYKGKILEFRDSPKVVETSSIYTNYFLS